MHQRLDGQQSSVAIQFDQESVPEDDLPQGVLKKDQFYVFIAGTRDVTVKDVDKCFQWSVGSLPPD